MSEVINNEEDNTKFSDIISVVKLMNEQFILGMITCGIITMSVVFLLKINK